MAVRLSDEDIEELCGDVVWVHQVSRENEFRVASLTEAARDDLIECFGQEWLDRYLRETVERLDRWAETGVDSAIH